MARFQYVGTRYHALDAYGEIIRRGSATPRVYSATHDGSVNGKPVLISEASLAVKRRDMGPYTFGAQMLLNPLAEERQTISRDWLRYYDGALSGEGMNRYLLVDPAHEKKKGSDYTAMWVIGLGGDRNYHVLDMLRDRLGLRERLDRLFDLHRRWTPMGVGYEAYGMKVEIEVIEQRQRQENYHFHLTELGGQVAKLDRIRRLIPSLAAGRWYFPRSLIRTDYEGQARDLVHSFVEEELAQFPLSHHDDMLDALARILDEPLGAIWPRAYDADANARPDRYRPQGRSGRSFMSA